MRKERKGTPPKKKYHLMSIYWIPAPLLGVVSHYHPDVRQLYVAGTIVNILCIILSIF